ncbi:ABC transporter permease, partial [Nonomuraea antimicrobica]|uniref:ABC transporter permease n=1 Tax=Nonomuraea antimicrobica TaxID=561173 RepID=UPI0031E7EFD7
ALGEAVLPGTRLPWARLGAGVLAAAGGVVLTVVLSGLTTEAAASPVTMFTALLWTTAVALLGPLIARAVTALPLRLPGAAGYLASKNLRASVGRMASVITPLTLLTALTCTILFSQTTTGHAAQRELDAGITADHVLAPGASAAAARRVPGVTAAAEILRTSVRIDLTKYGAQAVTALDGLADLGVVSGTLKGFADASAAAGGAATSAAVSSTAADRLDVTVGDRIDLVLGDGSPATVTVAAIYERGLGFGDLTLSRALVAGHVDDPRPTVLVAGGDRAALERAFPGVAVLDHAQAGAAGTGGAEVNYVAMGLIIAFCAIAVVNTLAMSISARSRELALLRLVGTTRRQLLRMLRVETLTATAVAVAIGTLISLAVLTAFSNGMTRTPLPYVPPLTYVAIIAVTAALAMAATAIPARLTLRVHPAEALGARE